MHIYAPSILQRPLDPVELKFQTVLRFHIGSRTEPGSSAITAGLLTSKTSFQSHNPQHYITQDDLTFKKMYSIFSLK